ncbi:MAG TPA: hypothetical protein VG370_13605 [Chloroflexota bacterium]|jgi:hypothetical protein|nr:hypothetical protein [Chloroflexota bacterium]
MGMRTKLAGALVAALSVVASVAPADAASQQAYLDTTGRIEVRVDANARRFLVLTPAGMCGGDYPEPAHSRVGRQRIVVERKTCAVDMSADPRYARGTVELANGQSYRFVARDLKTAMSARTARSLRPTTGRQ